MCVCVCEGEYGILTCDCVNKSLCKRVQGLHMFPVFGKSPRYTSLPCAGTLLAFMCVNALVRGRGASLHLFSTLRK